VAAPGVDLTFSPFTKYYWYLDDVRDRGRRPPGTETARLAPLHRPGCRRYPRCRSRRTAHRHAHRQYRRRAW
jgi:hypothetical protein